MISRKELYTRKGTHPMFFTEGDWFGYSDRFLGSSAFNTFVRRYASNTVAQACMPAVLEKESMVRPVIKPNINKAETETSKGSNKMNNGYT